jgi:AcrR family transcriptional regulator
MEVARYHGNEILHQAATEPRQSSLDRGMLGNEPVAAGNSRSYERRGTMSQVELEPAEDLRPDRRQRKKARTHRDLVEAAVRLFDERGFDGTTIEDITDAADVSPRTFFRYFSSKEEILFSEHQRSVDDLRNRLADCPEGEPLLVTVREAMLTIAGRIEENRDFHLLRMRLNAESPTVGAYALRVQQDWVRTIAKALATRLGVNVYTDLRPTLIAGAANVAIRSALTRWGAGRGREDLRALTSEAFRLLESGFGLGGREA